MSARRERERERDRKPTDASHRAHSEEKKQHKDTREKEYNLVPSRLSGLLVLPKPPPGICVDVRDGVPVELGICHVDSVFLRGESEREKAFTRVSHKGRPKFKNPDRDEKREENTPACVHILNIPRVNVL